MLRCAGEAPAGIHILFANPARIHMFCNYGGLPYVYATPAQMHLLFLVQLHHAYIRVQLWHVFTFEQLWHIFNYDATPAQIHNFVTQNVCEAGVVPAATQFKGL